MRIALSTYQQHVARWRDCTRCGLHEVRTRVVLARGTIPCDVLFIGEAPGESEDVIGRPFVGPAGRQLDQIVQMAFEGDPNVRTAFTNIVACIPIHGDGKDQPEVDEIEACRPRLEEIIALARPRLIVAVGKMSKEWTEPGYKTSPRLPDPAPEFAEIVHPAAILRAPWVQKSLMVKRAVVTLRNAVEALG